MPRVGLEPTIPVLERAKSVHTLDPLNRAATAVGNLTTVSMFIPGRFQRNAQWTW
jgi:hypothetical protein